MFSLNIASPVLPHVSRTTNRLSTTGFRVVIFCRKKRNMVMVELSNQPKFSSTEISSPQPLDDHMLPTTGSLSEEFYVKHLVRIVPGKAISGLF